jgi:hypothetical protein
MQIKIADFGLSRDFASTYMTGTLGTYVKINLFSIGWPHKYLIINLIHLRLMFTPSQLFFGRSWLESLPI